MATSIESLSPQRNGSKFTEKLLSGLRQCYDEQKLVDVTFKVSNPTVLIPAHRLVLSAVSAYFKNLFSSAQNETPFIEISDIDGDTFERLITYCYTGKTLITHENIDEMLKAAIILQLDLAVADCVDYIFENITEYTLERAHSLERETQCECLRLKVQEYEIQNFMEVSLGPGFLSFEHAKLKGILESEYLNVSSEKDAFAALKRWYEHDTVRREPHLADLIGCLRLLQFDANFILTNIQPLPGCEPLALKAIVWLSQPLARTTISLKFTEPRETLRKNFEEMSLLALEISRSEKTKSLLQYNNIEGKWMKYADIDTNDLSSFTVIPNNDNLIFIGGWRNKQTISEVKSWNLGTKTWKEMPAMTYSRYSHCVALLDDIIYAIGGREKRNALSSVEVFTSTREWHSVLSMKTPRYAATAVTLNGNIFVIGGCDGHQRLNSVERYDPTTNAWTSCADMNNAHVAHGAAAHKGLIYVVGMDGAERYDPQRDEWTQICPLPINHVFVACISINYQLWAIGGGIVIPKNYIYLYDEESDGWLQKATLPEVGKYSCLAVRKAFLERNKSQNKKILKYFYT